MPAPVHIHLTGEEDRTLYELSTAKDVPRRTKLRALCLRLNADGWTVPEIARHLKQSPQTSRQTLQRWQKWGLGGLWEATGRGGQSRWRDADIATVEQWLLEERTYTSRQLCEKLASERGVKLSPKQLSRILKKRAGFGSECDMNLPNPSLRLTSKRNEPIG